ncbi:hypothetical protein B7P43_G08673 [Cryptotermes secundus]|uniref:Uncharacterized protein n=1 Tax=Cryptotermes secundus TaxID=105785 RepID=A0A2J7PCC9_9NEOP|nr:hypothetical protein B7P43_G08673 [Cryptotermes secundus]
MTTSRCVIFAIHPTIKMQIEQIWAEDILEISDLPIISLMTIVHREDKAPRICIAARLT